MERLTQKLLEFRDDCRGIAAMEFALVLPMLSFLVFGGYAIFTMVNADRAVTRSAMVVSDLVSRAQSMSDAERDTFMAIAESLSGDLASDSSFGVTITSVSNTFDSFGNYDLTVDWSFANTPGLELDDSDLGLFDIPFVPEGESIILVDINVDYSPMYFESQIGSVSIGETSMRRPRFVPLVAYTGP